MRVLLASAVTALIATPALKVDAQEWTYGLANAGGSVWVGGETVTCIRGEVEL